MILESRMINPFEGREYLKMVYVAGPFRNKSKQFGENTPDTHWTIEQNIRNAEGVSLEVWKLGAVAVCPHLNTRHFQGELPNQAWLDGDFEIVRRCDAIVLVKGWETSAGSLAEKALMEELHRPVFDWSLESNRLAFINWVNE